MNAKHVAPRVAALLASVWLSGCALALPPARPAHAGEPAEQFVLARLRREAAPVSSLEAQAGTGAVELRPGAAVTVRAADSCAMLSNDGGRQGQCALAVEAVTAALLTAGYRVVHYSAFAEQRALAEQRPRAPAPAPEPKKHDPARPAASDDSPKPSEAEPGALGVEQLFVVEVAALNSEQRVSSDALTLFASDAQGHERATLPASNSTAQLASFARTRPPPPFMSSAAQLTVSVVAVQDGHVTLHYSAQAREQAAVACDRQFLFHVRGEYFEPTPPVLAPVALAAAAEADSAPPSALFERLAKALIDRVRSDAKVGF
jgi:hypothetical protein